MPLKPISTQYGVGNCPSGGTGEFVWAVTEQQNKRATLASLMAHGEVQRCELSIIILLRGAGLRSAGIRYFYGGAKDNLNLPTEQPL